MLGYNGGLQKCREAERILQLGYSVGGNVYSTLDNIQSGDRIGVDVLMNRGVAVDVDET